MSIIDNLRQRVSDAIQPKRNVSPRQRGRSNRDIGATNTGNELQASIRGTVFACLQHRANALSAIKFQSFLEKNYSLEELGQSHWTNRLLANPNPYFTRSQLFGYLENWLSINGNAFIWTPTNGYRVPLQMWVLNPTRMRVIRGTDNFVEGYIYQSAQEGNIALPENEVIHLARLHPASRPEEIIGMNIFGVGLVQAALDYANLDKDASAFLSRLFKNNATPPLIAKYPERFDYDEWEKLKARWNEELPDYKLRGLLASGLGLELPPKSEISASYDGISLDTRSQISQVFGVPPGMLTGEYQNRATAEVQWAIFRQNTIDPEALYIAEEFTRHFRRWEQEILIQAEPYVFDDPVAAIQKEEFELRWGLKTINDARTERGYDAVSDGDTPLIAAGYMPLDQIVFGAPTPPPTTRNIVGNVITHEVESDQYVTAELNERDIYWRKYDKLTLSNSSKIEKVVNQGIAELNRQMKRQLQQNNKNFKKIDFSPKTYRAFEKAVNESCNNVGSQLSKEYKLEKGTQSPIVQENIAKTTAQSMAQLKESAEVMKKEVLNTFKKASATKDPAKIKNAMDRKFQSLEKSRAQTIAQTTSANATSSVQHTVFKENNIKMMWLTQRDGRVRFAHQAVDGKYPNRAGYFIVGGEKTTRPLGPGLSAGNVVNCRCQLFPVSQ
jgi:HK97 family phage portal protein